MRGWQWGFAKGANYAGRACRESIMMSGYVAPCTPESSCSCRRHSCHNKTPQTDANARLPSKRYLVVVTIFENKQWQTVSVSVVNQQTVLASRVCCVLFGCLKQFKSEVVSGWVTYRKYPKTTQIREPFAICAWKNNRPRFNQKRKQIAIPGLSDLTRFGIVC